MASQTIFAADSEGTMGKKRSAAKSCRQAAHRHHWDTAAAPPTQTVRKLATHGSVTASHNRPTAERMDNRVEDVRKGDLRYVDWEDGLERGIAAYATADVERLVVLEAHTAG